MYNELFLNQRHERYIVELVYINKIEGQVTRKMTHFTILDCFTKILRGSEVGVDFVVTQTLVLFIYQLCIRKISTCKKRKICFFIKTSRLCLLFRPKARSPSA